MFATRTSFFGCRLDESVHFHGSKVLLDAVGPYADGPSLGIPWPDHEEVWDLHHGCSSNAGLQSLVRIVELGSETDRFQLAMKFACIVGALLADGKYTDLLRGEPEWKCPCHEVQNMGWG